MSKSDPITKDEIEALKELINLFNRWLSKNDSVAKRLKLRSKFAGDLGEATAINELYGHGYRIMEWRGKNKKGADIIITTKKSKRRQVQIKTTTTGNNAQVFVSKIKRGKKLRNKGKLNKSEKESILNSIKDNITKNEADYWVIVNAKRDPEYFILDKKHFAELLTKAQEGYMKKKHTKRYHFGITKNGDIRHIIELKSLKRYQKWGVIR